MMRLCYALTEDKTNQLIKQKDIAFARTMKVCYSPKRL